jgi:hypothetical protein
VIQTIPTVNRLSLHKDIRQFTDTFDFDISYRIDANIDLHSHDFVEFYFMLDGAKFQIGCGFVEDFVSETSSNQHHFQANGRDFLGQLFNLNFLQAFPFKETTMINFLNACIANAYMPKYLDYKKIPNRVINNGAYAGSLVIQELTDAKIAPIVQSTADEVYNVVYQNRLGQLVVWGRNSPDEIGGAGHSLNEIGDPNVMKFQLRENFSKVFSECKVFYTGGEGNLDYKNTPSQLLKNTEPKAREIYQPEIRTFQTSTLIKTAGQVTIGDKKDQYAASILRKSNQNLTQIMISTSRPFFVTRNLERIPYEVNQLWSIRSQRHGINQLMRLVAISYAQESSSLTVDLLFIGKDTLT